jgi:hypothetical protein
MDKKKALAQFLSIDVSEVGEGQDGQLEADGNTYLVLTDDEATEKAKENIKETVWAFKSEFLVAHMPEGVTEDVIEAIQKKYDNANPALLKLLNDFDHFVNDAFRSDGRGNFLNTYDGEEYEQGEFFIYRID